MKKYNEYAEWFDSLTLDKKRKLELISQSVISKADMIWKELSAQLMIRKSFAFPHFKNEKDFINYELFKASEELTHINLSCNWNEVGLELTKIRDQYIIKDHEISFGVYGFNIENIPIIFIQLISSAGLMNEFLNINNKYNNDCDFKSLRNFDKVIEFMGRIGYLMLLFVISEQELYSEKEIFQYINKHSIQGKKELKSFDSIFTHEEHGSKILKILTDEEYLISGTWSYFGDGKSIATPFYILRDYFGLIKKDGSPLGNKLKIWCSGLGINKTNNQIRNLKNNPDVDGKNPTRKYRMQQKEFFVLFSSHFQPIKQLDNKSQ